MLFVGDDWAEAHHDIEIVDEAGQRLARRRLPEGLEGISRLHALIAAAMPAEWAELDDAEAAAPGEDRDRDRAWPVGGRAGRRGL